MEYTLTIRDILKSMMISWKTIIAIMVVTTGVGLLLPSVSNSNSNDFPNDEISQIEEQQEVYDAWQEAKQETAFETSEDLVSAYDYLKASSYMAIDAYDCRYCQIVIEMKEDTLSCKTGLIDALIAEGFSDNKSGEGIYLTDVRCTFGEAIITIWDNGTYSLEEASTAIKEYIIPELEKRGISILSVDSFIRTGFSSDLFEKQDILRKTIVRIQEEMTSYNANTAITAPPQNNLDGNANNHGAQKGAVLGCLLGLIIGAVLSIIRVVIKGTILSEAQVEDMFHWVKLGSYIKDNEGEAALLSATIEAKSKSGAKVVVFNDTASKDCDDLIACLNQKGSNEYYSSSCLMESLESAEKLIHADGVIIPVLIGKTSIKSIRRSLQWASRFNKDVIGYITLRS